MWPRSFIRSACSGHDCTCCDVGPAFNPQTRQKLSAVEEEVVISNSRSIHYCTCDVGPAFKPQTRQLLQASFSANCSRPASDTALPSRWTSAWLDRDLQNMRDTRSLLLALRVWTEQLISIFQGVRPLPYLGQDPFSKNWFQDKPQDKSLPGEPWSHTEDMNW